MYVQFASCAFGGMIPKERKNIFLVHCSHLGFDSELLQALFKGSLLVRLYNFNDTLQHKEFQYVS